MGQLREMETSSRGRRLKIHFPPGSESLALAQWGREQLPDTEEKKHVCGLGPSLPPSLAMHAIKSKRINLSRVRFLAAKRGYGNPYTLRSLLGFDAHAKQTTGGKHSVSCGSYYDSDHSGRKTSLGCRLCTIITVPEFN